MEDLMRGLDGFIFYFLKGYEAFWILRDGERLKKLFADTACVGRGKGQIVGRNAIDSYIDAVCSGTLSVEEPHILKECFAVDMLLQNDRYMKLKAAASVVFVTPEIVWKVVRMEFVLQIENGAIHILRERDLIEETSGCVIPTQTRKQLILQAA